MNGLRRDETGSRRLVMGCSGRLDPGQVTLGVEVVGMKEGWV